NLNRITLLSLHKADIVFLVDGSDNMQPNERLILEFVTDFVKKLEIGPSKAQVALVQYSTEPTADFTLNKYSLKEDTLNHLSNVQLKGGGSVNTGRAIDFVRNTIFTASSGSRLQQGVPQVLILASGRKSEDDILRPLLLSATATLRGSVSPGIAALSKSGRDVVFLLDGSDGTRTGFPAMRDFVQRVVETLSVDDNKDRVSVVQYSRDPAVQFYLNTYATKGEILDAVRGLRHKGGRPLNTGAALQYLRDNVFTSSAGSRRPEGVPQVLVLLSGGKSFDIVDAPAAALKQMGVLIFAIGSRGSDSRELQKVSHDPNYALSVSEFTDLPSVQQQLQASVEAVVVDVTPESPTVLGRFSSMLL
uniref:VWFA domain-containing protein n=1 Tax=Xiphophorus maculatus TaxID=8083 RepID=A0A3B5R426_XIPMA